jgi:hypothetical protein
MSRHERGFDHRRKVILISERFIVPAGRKQVFTLYNQTGRRLHRIRVDHRSAGICSISIGDRILLLARTDDYASANTIRLTRWDAEWATGEPLCVDVINMSAFHAQMAVVAELSGKDAY